MTRLLFVLGALAISYAISVLLCWSFNPADWTFFGRLIFIVLAISLSAVAYVLTMRMSTIYKAVEARKEQEANERRKAGGFQGMLQKQLDEAERKREEMQKQV